MKLSESYARSIIDAVESGESERCIAEMLNDFLADKVRQTTKYDVMEDSGIYASQYGDLVYIHDLLTDN